ncbi:MAG TPA: rod shape-determining protein MreC [Melioribacteraceae bacterium]|nr:rod shape-determining protein MreC [Melioribacteraceae bacterium]
MFKFIVKFYNDFKEYFILSFLLFISLLILSFNKTEQMNTLRGYFFTVFAPLNSAFTQIYSIFLEKYDVYELQRRNAELMLENNLLRSYAIQNMELKSIMKLQDTSKLTLKRAKVISKLVSSAQGNLIINIGKNEGIDKGMPVINDKGLIGIVQTANSNYSLVKHINNTSFKIAAKDQRTGINGIVSWNGVKMVMNNIQGADSVYIGDRIVTSDFSTVAPPNIPIGIVKSKEPNNHGVGYLIVIEPFVNLDWVSYAFVYPIAQDSLIEKLKTSKPLK